MCIRDSPEESATTLPLLLRTFAGTQITVYVDPSDTVKQLKHRIQSTCGPRETHLTILYRTQILPDDTPITEFADHASPDRWTAIYTGLNYYPGW